MKTMGRILLVTGTVVGISVVNPAVTHPAVANSAPDKLVCSPSQNDGRLVGGVCSLPAAQLGRPYEGFILTSRGSGGTFRISAGGPPPGLTVPRQYGAAGTIVAGTPTRQGTFTFSVKGVDQEGEPLAQTYGITVGPPPPLQVSPTGGCRSGTVGAEYEQFFFAQGGVEPWTWSLRSGSFPPGLGLSSPNGPTDQDSALTGTPTATGSFTFTMQVTDSHGDMARSAPCTVTIRA
ncbi:MAG TPA: putative Ig domain-containing protein [Acidimicrobiales bacterium]|nr:putative Ig domain-containing protein [Acidimicrobiales bacterium]